MHLDKYNKYSTMLANLPSKKTLLEIVIRVWLGLPFILFINLFLEECS